MEDNIQIILYIIFVLFAIVSRLLKSNKAKPAPKSLGREEGESHQENSRKRQMSFEELLREFTEEKEVPPEVQDVSKPVHEAIDDDEVRRVYERSIRDSEKYDERHANDDRHTGNFQHFAHYSEADTEESQSEFARLLSDGDEVRKAVIMKEILDRKY